MTSSIKKCGLLSDFLLSDHHCVDIVAGVDYDFLSFVLHSLIYFIN